MADDTVRDSHPHDQARALLSEMDCPESRRIAVLGAGIAGLYAAYLLADKGHHVSVFEATERVGGRILTHRYQGRHAELGAMRIPSSARSTLSLCEELGLPLTVFANSAPNTFLDIRGTVVRKEEAHKISREFALDPLDKRAIADDVDALFKALGGQLVASLTMADLLAIKEGNMRTARARVRELEATSIRDYFLRHTRNREGAEFVASLHHLHDVWMGSCASLIREFIRAELEKGPTQLMAGMDALPTALYERIKEDSMIDWHFGTEVTGITASEHTVQVDCGDSVETFDRALCTIPFPVLATMSLAGIAHDKRNAIRHFRYAPATKVVLQFKENFWNSGAQPIRGGITVSDRIAGQIVYPTDLSASGHSNEIPLVFPSAATTSPPTNSAEPYQGPDLLMSYTWGDRARQLSSVSPNDRVEVVLDCIEQIHGAQARDLFDGGVSQAWERDRFSGGAFSQPRTRGLDLFYDTACRPEGALYFAGEHLSPDPGWIHGSLDSTLKNVLKMLSRE